MIDQLLAAWRALPRSHRMLTIVGHTCAALGFVAAAVDDFGAVAVGFVVGMAFCLLTEPER